MSLTFLFTQTGATTDDLLEFRHGADHLIKNDQLSHLAVRTGGQQLGGGCNDRAFLAGGDKILQLTLAVIIAAGDTQHIIGILLNHIGIQIHQRLPHPFCCVFRCTEDNGFGHTISRLQITGDFGRNLMDTVFDDNIVIVITVSVDPIINLIAINISLTLTGTPSVANVGHDIDNLEGGKETILDTLLQTVGVYGLTEIAQVRNILRLLGCCGHADLGCSAEVFQNLTPAAFFLGRATMTLINDDQIKEIRREQFAEMFLVIITHQLLIQ